MLGIAGPVVLGSMLSGAMGRRGYGHGRNFSMGGLGGGMMPAAGLGSLIGMLSGGRHFGNTGGLFGRTMGRGFGGW